MTELSNLFDWFKRNKPELIKKYKDKYIVIVNDDVADVFDNESTAFHESVKKYGLGNFLIQFCTDNDSELAQTYHSRVYF